MVTDLNYFDMMSRAQKLYGRILEPVCRKWDLTRNELDVMLFLANQPGLDRAVDIVNNRGLSKSHVSLSVTNLESRGLLIRTEDPNDRRTIHLSLTRQAQDIVGDGRDAQQRYFGQLFRNVTQEEFARMAQFTRKVSDNLAKWEEEI